MDAPSAVTSMAPAFSAVPRPATQIDRARWAIGAQRVEQTLCQRRGGGPNLGSRHGRGPQQTVAIGGEKSVAVA